MSQQFDSEHLIEACRRTHQDMQRSAARSASLASISGAQPIQQTASVNSIESPEIQQTPSVESFPMPIYASKHQLYLPSKQEFAAQLESAHRELDERGIGRDE